LKQRNYFVSNSSSSSYICEVCGNEYSGFDVSLYDAEMYECKHRHVFCEDHVDKNVLAAWKETEIQRYMKEYELTHDEAEDELENDSDYRYDFPENVCPCCTLKTIVDNDLITYLLHISNMTRLECEDVIRSKFTNSKELNEICK